MEDRLMTLMEAKQYLKVARSVVLKLLQEKKIRAKKVGRKWIIMKSEIDKFLTDFDEK